MDQCNIGCKWGRYGWKKIAYVSTVSNTACSELDPQVDVHAYLQVPVFHGGTERTELAEFVSTSRLLKQTSSISQHGFSSIFLGGSLENQYDSRARHPKLQNGCGCHRCFSDQAEINDLKSRSTSCETRQKHAATRGKVGKLGKFRRI